MRLIKKIVNYILWTVAGLFLLVTILLHIPYVQGIVGSEIASALAGKLGTRVEIGRVDIGFLNRLVIDDVHIYDQQHKPMLFATRLAAKVDIIPLLEKRISISSAQLFGVDANMYKQKADGQTNFQFVVDSLKSKNSSTHTPLDLRISSLVIRNGKVRWNDYSKKKLESLDVNHLTVSNLSAHILINHITDNSLDAAIKRLSFKEQSGLDLRNLEFRLKVDRRSAVATDFKLSLPRTDISLPLVRADYKMKGKTVDRRSLKFSATLDRSTVAPSDLGFLDPTLRGFSNRFNIEAKVRGTGSSVDLTRLRISTDDQSIIVSGKGRVDNLGRTPRWSFVASQLKTSADGIKYVARNLQRHKINLPKELVNLGDFTLSGKASGQGRRLAAEGLLRSAAGNVTFKAYMSGPAFDAAVKTPGINLGRILDNDDFGMVVADVSAKGRIPSPFKFTALEVTAKGLVGRFDYKGYSYRNIAVDGTLANAAFAGKASINDPNGKLTVDGMVSRNNVKATVEVRNFNPNRLKLTNALGDRTFSLTAKANLAGADLDHLNGTLDVTDFSAIGGGTNCNISNLHTAVRNNFNKRSADIIGDFGEFHIKGIFDYQNLPNSIASVVGRDLPSVIGSGHKPSGSSYSFYGRMASAQLLRQLFGIQLNVNGPVDFRGAVNDAANDINFNLSAPDVVYNGNRIKDVEVNLGSKSNLSDAPDNAASGIGRGLLLHVRGQRVNDNGSPLALALNADIFDDNVRINANWDLEAGTHNYGNIHANARLFSTSSNGLGASVDILPSEEVFDTIHLSVQPSHFDYQHNRLNIDHFVVSNGNQYVTVNGQTSGHENDSLLVDFRNIDLKYVLDIVGFNSVTFTGNVTGKGYVKSFFKNPKAYADFDVADFRFQGGEFGTLHAKANYDSSTGRITINSTADDGPGCYTDINGYVSIKDNYIDLPMMVHGTKLQFLEGFAGAVMKDVKATGDGWCRIFGDLSHVNLEGDVYGNGDITIKQTNTTYTMRKSLIHMVPNEIEFANDTVYDRDGHIGIVKGAIHHKELHKLTFDIHLDADNLLCLNLPEFDDRTFRGVIYGKGHCDIIGRAGETTINANITPVGKSFMEYDAGYSGSLDDNSFIHWNDVTPKTDSTFAVESQGLSGAPGRKGTDDDDDDDIPGDLVMNLIVNTTPDFTLRVLMDETTGDHMDFHGDGVVRATYFNKGAFQMFGNYNVEYGKYTMTIQNLVKKAFEFQPGSSVVFGGNPFDARLNLKAQYTVNGVSLSDLQMGRSFTSSNIRVNCLMNIIGTPQKPTITFGIDFPTLSTDVQQMVRSVINSEDDLNQQVLYLLAVGRFYNPGNNNAEVEREASQNQTSLAMQSVLSGTLSQQLSSILSSVVHNTNWNIGANISTGDEGFSDAEYEGLLSGRMLNNRLFFQGQFGYRDKVTTNNSSFIGDFDLRYLLTPNGNISLRVYNQTNDRYFTRNSLNTQGVGFVLKKDFSNILDLFGIKKKAAKKRTSSKKTKAAATDKRSRK